MEIEKEDARLLKLQRITLVQKMNELLTPGEESDEEFQNTAGEIRGIAKRRSELVG